MLLTCTGAGSVLVDIETMVAGRIGATDPLLVVDIAVPRDVAAEVTALDGVTLLNLDDLRDWADRGLRPRAGEADRVRDDRRRGGRALRVEATARQAAPLVSQLHQQAEAVRLGELERFATRLAALDDAAARHASTRSPRASSPSCCTSRRSAQGRRRHAAGRAQRRRGARPVRPRLTAGMPLAAPRLLRLATRSSAQATHQARPSPTRCRAAHPGIEVELVFVETLGDQLADVPLHTIGGQGVFVKEVQRAVLAGTPTSPCTRPRTCPRRRPTG